MRLTSALLGCLIVAVPSILGRKLTSSTLTLPLESQVHLVPATEHLQQIQRHLPTFFAVRQLEAVKSTSSSSEGSSHYSTSTSATSCTESVDGVSVISRVVVNGTRFGACYSNTSFQLSGYPAYLTSQEKNGLTMRGDEGLVVAETEGSNETSLVWALAQFVPGGPELDRVICYNPVGVSSVGAPTSSLLDGEWICDLDGNGGYSRVDDIQIDCGCSAGIDATEYYACEEHEDLALNSSGGFIIDGVSLDGCYTINTMTNLFGYYAYFAGPAEDGVPMLFVANYYNALTDEDILYWSLGVYNESGLDPSACFLGVEVLNTTADQTTPLSDGDWVCDLDGDGTYELYDDTVDVQCACIDDSYTTCFENAEGMSLDSTIMYEGDSIGGCYVPTIYMQGNAQVFSLFGDPVTTVGSIIMSFLHFEDTAINFTGNVWAVSQVRDYEEDKGITTVDIICLTLVDGIELPTDSLLQGEWSCRDAAGEYFKPEESDFKEVTCGCRSDAPSGLMPVGVGPSTPVPMLAMTSLPSSLLYPALSPEATTVPKHPLPSSTRHPEDSDAGSTDDASEEKTRQYTPVGIIVGGSVGGATLIAGVVTIVLCGRRRSRTSVRDTCFSPAGSTSGRGHVDQTRVRNGTPTPQGQNIPPVNPGRPVTTNGYVNGSNDQSSPPSYLDTVNP